MNFNLLHKIIALILGITALGVGASVLPENVDKIVPINKIYTSNGEITVENEDDNSNETFIIKSDKEVYSGGNFDMIISVTNLREDEEGTLKLIYSKGETLNSVSKYIPVSSIINVPVYTDIEVTCPETSTSTNCYEKQQTNTVDKSIITDSWEEITLKDKSNKSNPLKKQTVGEYDNKEITYLFPKGTTFLKLNISYEDSVNFRDKFYIEVFGENGGYGLLDPLITSLVSYYPLDSDSTDSVTTNDGTDTDMSYATAGKIANGGTFNGSSSVIGLPTSAFNTALSTAISVSMWVKFASNTTNQKIFVINSSPADSPEIQMWSTYSAPNVTFNFNVYDSSATQGYVSKDIAYDTNWHHIVVVGTTNDFRIYVDGVAGSTDTSGSFNIDSIGEMALGHYTLSGVYFNGMLDEVGIWSRALTVDEVADLYNGGDGLAYPLVPATPSTPTEDYIILFE